MRRLIGQRRSTARASSWRRRAARPPDRSSNATSSVPCSDAKSAWFGKMRPGRRMRMGKAPKDRGFILVSVRWLLALLTLIALALTASVRRDVRARGQLLRHAEAEAMADGLTRLVALRLGDRDRRPPTETGIVTDGTPLLCSH